jgi:hypothetical protein
MPINKLLLKKGMKYMLYALPLMFIGPSVIYNAFINKDNVWHYLVLAIGILLCLSAVFLMYRGIKTLTDAIFEHDA